MKKTILITGGTGYIGSHGVVAFEQAGYKTVIVDNLSNSKVDALDGIEKILGYKPDFFQVDLRDKDNLEEVFKKYDFDGVIHFAGLKAVGESCEKPLEYFDNNIVGSIRLFELMEKYNVKNIIFSSSATVYEPQEVQIPLSISPHGREEAAEEEQPHPSPLLRGEGIAAKIPLSNFPPEGERIAAESGLREDDRVGNTSNTYGTTKFLLEQILGDLSKFSGFNVMNLRYFNPIGAHESGYIGEEPDGIPNNLLPFIMKVAKGELEKLKVFGDDYDTLDGTGVRDYIDVVDLIEGHLKAYGKLSPLSISPQGREVAAEQQPHPSPLLRGEGIAAKIPLSISPQGREEAAEGFFETYNLGVGRGVSVLEMIEVSRKITGKEIDYDVVGRRDGDLAMVYCNAKKAKKELDWEAKVSLEDSIKNSWKFYNK